MNIIRPQPLRTDGSNAFAHRSMKIRVPAIIREVQALNPDYPASIMHALDALHDGIQTDTPIPMLSLPAPDYDEWATAYAPHAGETWLHSYWFFTEIFFYRHLIQTVRWWETGRDPFAPKKAEEMASPALWERLELALSVCDLPPAERIASAIQHSLWGNRIDLSYAVAASHGSTWVSEDLLVNDSERAAERILAAHGEVHIVNDNAGTELATDLALVDALLNSDVERVMLHLKLHPTFVSDATTADVISFIALMATGEHGTSAYHLSERLGDALSAGRLRLAPDGFWNSTRFAWEMPPRLVNTFKRALLVLVKGDANYRRIVGDALWPPITPFSEVLSYFPAPVLAVRTLKSDPVLGLTEGLAERLDSIDKEWRVNGRRGLIQMS